MISKHSIRWLSLLTWILLLHINLRDSVSPASFRDIPAFKYILYSSEELNAFNHDRKKDKIERNHAYDNPDKFAEYQNAIRTRYGRINPDYRAGYLVSEYNKAHQFTRQHHARVQAAEWQEHGPANVPGRTRTMLNMPGDPSHNTWIAGAVGGGIWKTSNGGKNWRNVSADLTNLSIVSLAFSASDPNIIYAGTGESYGSGGLIEIIGQGMFKSLDGGETWHPLSSTTEVFNFMSVNDVVVDPFDPEVLLVSVNQNVGRGIGFTSGIYKSTDGGDSWYQVFDAPAWVQQILFESDNFNVMYASVYGTGIAKSTDAGESWHVTSNGIYPSGRLSLAISTKNKNRLYAIAEGELSDVDSDFYISEDGGENWSLVVEERNATNRNFFAASQNSIPQGGWNNVVAVHPFDDDIAYVGGVDLWKMEMKVGTIDRGRRFLGVSEDSTDQFMYFINFGAEYWAGRLEAGDIAAEDFVTVEIRFGEGLSQKAHRFETPMDGGSNSDGGAGIPDEEYAYQDYVEVPYEVWDMDADRQLMVSFRDQAKNGVWDLLEEQTEGLYSGQSREYIFIHDITYDPENPVPGIMTNAGHTYSNMYFIWPVLEEDFIFDADNLPASKLVIKWGELMAKQRETTRMTTWAGGEFEDGRILPYVHADQHTILPVITDSRNGIFKLLVTNDGGVFQSIPDQDPGLGTNSWLFSGNGYNTSQFYGIDKKAGSLEFVGGLQDNGSFLSPAGVAADRETSYAEVGGGDGMEAVWNYGNPDEIMISIYNNQLYKTVDGGDHWFDATSGLSDINERAPFVTKLGNSKSNPEVLYTIGASGVWRSENFGDSWELTEINESWLVSSSMDVEVSRSNYNIVWAGSGMDDHRRIFVSTDAGMTFNPVSNYEFVELGTITGISTHPAEDSTAYLLFSFAGAPKILRTRDLGATWEDLSGFGTNDASANGFPDVAVHCLFVMPHDPNHIWAGTEIGIFESFDNGGSWELSQSGFPSVSVWDMKQVDDKIIVGTHGRGIWSATIPELTEIPVSPRILALGVNVEGNLVVKLGLRSSYDSSSVMVNNSLSYSLGTTQKKDSIITIPYDNEGPVTARLISYSNGNAYLSDPASFDFFEPAPVVDQYVNDLNDPVSEGDFKGNGFSVRNVKGFRADDLAIHSQHDYETDTTYYYYLKVPVRIAENIATFQYEDITLVEKGEPGTKFGDFEFWDYVIIEGTIDGVNWIPLSDGYDSRAAARWINAYNAGKAGSEDLYLKQDLDLLKVFNPGDEVMFRFRLYSDRFTVGWGWAIDNIFIQEERPVALLPELDHQINLRIYPNPVIGQGRVEFILPHADYVILNLADISGKLYHRVNMGLLQEGTCQYTLDLTTFPDGLYFLNLSTINGTQTLRFLKR